MKDVSRIRKDVGELTLKDLELARVWQFGLDEECDEDQTECTVRPLLRKRTIDGEKGMYAVVCDFTPLKSDPKKSMAFVGMVFPTGAFSGAGCGDPCLLVDRPVNKIVRHPILKKYNGVLSEGSPRINLGLRQKKFAPQGEARTLMDLSYKILGLPPKQLFPLMCRPRVAIKGWPDEFKIGGFLQPKTVPAESWSTVT